ncbi:hypothetical protein ACP275_14G228600 [Erythranthe tilingii]
MSTYDEVLFTTIEYSDHLVYTTGLDPAASTVAGSGSGAAAETSAANKITYPSGFRFVPTDEELIVEYLKRKKDKERIPVDGISVVNLYLYNPHTLAEKYPQLGDNEWYFFTPRDRKYPNGSRPNRAAGTGYWKATGSDKAIHVAGEIVGYKKSLVFYKGRPPRGDKTDWIMHEYRLPPPDTTDKKIKSMQLDDCVLCRIYKKLPQDPSTKKPKKMKSDEDSSMPTRKKLKSMKSDDVINLEHVLNPEQLSPTVSI